MTLTQFEHLPPFEKVQVLNQQGVFLAQRRGAKGRIYLYAVDYFYVELQLDPYGLQNKGLHIHRVFGETRCLDIWLGGVDITELQYC